MAKQYWTFTVGGKERRYEVDIHVDLEGRGVQRLISRAIDSKGGTATACHGAIRVSAREC